MHRHELKKIKDSLRRIPVLGRVLQSGYLWFAERRFSDSGSYWEKRYQLGGDSGDGSYGALAEFKAEVLNALVAENRFQTIIEFGCGDGNQLALAEYPHYHGYDISSAAIRLCSDRFAGDDSKLFTLMDEYAGETADLALSLDVIFHLVEDTVFDASMRRPFPAADKMVVIYASNTDEQEPNQPPHVRHRQFTPWVEEFAPAWRLDRCVENRLSYDPQTGLGSPASFFMYRPAR